MTFNEASLSAIRNIAKYGDTDIFPFLVEKNIFYDCEEDCHKLLLKIDQSFETYFAQNPPGIINTLTQVGYTGFRWASQIEPFWNAYYLALVLTLAQEIEKQRIPYDYYMVFSYRYEYDENDYKLFKDSTWNHYKKNCSDNCDGFDYIIETDISDFYHRIYHHRIENSLMRVKCCGDIPSKIMKLLSHFSNNVSYGLPIGGPGSRILAELALNAVDQLLLTKGISFCRYADDYTIFCKTKSDAYKTLIILSEYLYLEGLILQKKKTRILSLEEYKMSTNLLRRRFNTDSEVLSPEEKLLNISLHYDPYSETATEDYIKLKDAIKGVDIIGILGRELNKTAIDITVTKQAINAMRALDNSEREGAILTILQENNLEILAPVFVTVLMVVRAIYNDLNAEIQDNIDDLLLSMYHNNSHLLSVELHLSYFVQVLSQKSSPKKIETLIKIFDSTSNCLIKRQIILILANWNVCFWISSLKLKYSGFTEWEKRTYIIASYFLGDEGKHWRSCVKPSWSDREIIVRNWFSKRFERQKNIPI